MARGLLFAAQTTTLAGSTQYYIADTDGTITQIDLDPSRGPVPSFVAGETPVAPGYVSGTVGDRGVWATVGRDASGASVTGLEIALSDGTTNGTRMVDLDGTGANSFPDNFVSVGDLTYFRAQQNDGIYDLWVTDGTANGTARIFDATSPSRSVVELENGVAGDAFYFQAGDNQNQPSLYRAVNGVVTLIDAPGTDPSIFYGYSVGSLGDTAYIASDRLLPDNDFSGPFLYKHDDGDAGLVRVDAGWGTSYEQVAILGNTDDYLIFAARNPVDNSQYDLFRTDGSEPGTRMISANADYASEKSEFAFSIGNIYIATTQTSFSTFGFGIDAVNATTGTTERLVDFGTVGGSGEHKLFEGGAKAILVNGDNNDTMWVTDGTAAGTTRLLQFTDVTEGAIDDLTAVGDKMFFTAQTDAHGTELWMTDGTAAGTGRVSDINPGTFSSSPKLIGAIELPEGTGPGGPDGPTEGRDDLTGTSGADTIRALGGNDTVYGLGGNDRLFGQGGSDLLLGGAGKDRLDGGAGRDGLVGDGGADKIFGGKGNDVLNGGRGNDTLDGGAGRDELLGKAGNDMLIGGAGNDELIGNGGKDRAIGGAGLDILTGGGGNDRLSGGGGDDFANGGGGRDVIEGGAGDDIMNGGGGADRFLFRGTATGDDQITDFVLGTDIIDLTRTDAQAQGLSVGGDAAGNGVISWGGDSITLVGHTQAEVFGAVFDYVDL